MVTKFSSFHYDNERVGGVSSFTPFLFHFRSREGKEKGEGGFLPFLPRERKRGGADLLLPPRGKRIIIPPLNSLIIEGGRE